MHELKFYPEARQDLTRIWFDVADYRESHADWIVDELVRRMAQLADFPEIGAPRDNLLGGCRMLLVRRYLVLYRIEKQLGEIHVLRVLEGERDLTDLM